MSKKHSGQRHIQLLKLEKQSGHEAQFWYHSPEWLCDIVNAETGELVSRLYAPDIKKIKRYAIQKLKLIRDLQAK